MTILIAFHLSGMRNPKHFYVFYVKQRWKEEFPCLVSYNRFVEFQQKKVLPLVSFLKKPAVWEISRESASWIPPHGKHVTSSGNIPTAYLTVWQPRVGQPWAGSLVLSYTLSSTTKMKLAVLSLPGVTRITAIHSRWRAH